MNLKEKEEYYRYSRPYGYKQPPTLNPELATALKRTGLDKSYRLLWSGVCGVRTHECENATNPVILGDRRAFAPGFIQYNGRSYPIFEPKYLFVRATNVVAWSFQEEDKNGEIHTVRTTRPDFIPPGRLVSEEREFYDLGVLRWQLEYRTPDVERDGLGVNDTTEDDGWSWIMTLQSTRGTYYEPGLEMMQIIEKREDQNRNADLQKVAEEQMAATAKRELEREAKDDKELRDFSKLISNEVESHVARQPHSVSLGT